ncbi:hypothetical protein ACMD2_16769 [Ananas comosus]|uniref:PLAT domain-containing protein n=1 Tax=Ananas comosus TaxID=4615 RepID=A0A199UJK7_ANACO|nr:hypothetical protein ACMD2_16769 [Ananas comosus]
MTSPPCRLNLTSDGTGANPGWYCKYVQVTTTGPQAACAQQLFTVEQWLATDTAPNQLYALRDNCAAPPRPRLRDNFEQGDVASGPDFRCTKERFDFNVWLDTGSGYHLSAVRDNCGPQARSNGHGDGNVVDGDQEK